VVNGDVKLTAARARNRVSSRECRVELQLTSEYTEDRVDTSPSCFLEMSNGETARR
jgi:hypothetical protein